MKRYLHFSSFRICILTVFILFITTSFVKAQETKITLSGYTEDVIVDTVLNTLPTVVTTNNIDNPSGSGNTFYAQGYSNNSVPYTNGGLPANGQFTDSLGHNFQLAPYIANNDLRLVALQSGTLTFAVSDTLSYDTLLVLGTAGNGFLNVNYTINYTDLSTSTGTFIILDWLNNLPTNAIQNLNRVERTTGLLDSLNLNQFVIREYPIVLSGGNQTKHISSITFSVPSGATGVANIFGITGITTTTLPVTLEYYTARVENGKALLLWKTSQELNNKQFIIERSTSTNPSSFVTVGNVNASPSANGSIYQFTNDPGISGTYLYRLSQEDFDGNIKILGIKSITFNGKNKWVVQDLGYQWKLICEQPFTYRVLDFQGRIITSAKGSGSATITKPAANGIYQIQVQTGGGFSSQSLLK